MCITKAYEPLSKVMLLFPGISDKRFAGKFSALPSGEKVTAHPLTDGCHGQHTWHDNNGMITDYITVDHIS